MKVPTVSAHDLFLGRDYMNIIHRAFNSKVWSCGNLMQPLSFISVLCKCYSTVNFPLVNYICILSLFRLKHLNEAKHGSFIILRNTPAINEKMMNDK